MSNVLIFTGGESPKKEDTEKWLQFFNSFDFIIAADSGLHTAIKWKINPNLIVGDMDSISSQSILPKNGVIKWPKDKDYSDTELALQEARSYLNKMNEASKKRDSNIILIGGDGGRIDHFMAILSLFSGELYPDVWICKEQIIFCLDERKKPEIKIDGFDTTSYISVFSVNKKDSLEKSIKVTSKGLKWPLDSVSWEKGFISLSNRPNKKEKITINVESGRFLLIVPIETDISK